MLDWLLLDELIGIRVAEKCVVGTMLTCLHQHSAPASAKIYFECGPTRNQSILCPGAHACVALPRHSNWCTQRGIMTNNVDNHKTENHKPTTHTSFVHPKI